MQRIAVIVGGKITAIHTNLKDKTQLSYDKLADITFRPDAKVGDDYPLCSLAELAAKQPQKAGGS